MQWEVERQIGQQLMRDGIFTKHRKVKLELRHSVNEHVTGSQDEGLQNLTFTTNNHEVNSKVGQMLSWWTKNLPHSINIRDTNTKVLP